MTKYTIEIEIEDHDLWSALEGQLTRRSAGTYMDIKDKLFEELTKDIDKYELDMVICGRLTFVDEQITWIEEMGYDVEEFLEDMGYENVKELVAEY